MITPYFPDCFVSSSNTLVETKSPWTWNLDPERNIAKISASLSAGYNVQVVIWAPDKTLVSSENSHDPKGSGLLCFITSKRLSSQSQNVSRSVYVSV